ncbi:MAG TPA: protoporphyrinogen oxidase [Fimbriimonadaceae bacterium]|nr:protoporphyrinogen oxidase [Fimbriimonadaceae bacterium]
MRQVVVIGGGMAGLSAAYFLQKSPNVRVTLLEASERFGGKVGTERVGDLLVEQGPDSVFSVKPAAIELAIELGMENDLIEPLQFDFSILVNGKLHHVPRALASLMPSASTALEKAEFFGASTKRRILKEKDAPKGDGQDESIASFFRRRFGRKFSNLLAEPLLAGIHAGDPEKLSMKALYPTYLGLEQKKGSLTGPTDQPAAASGHNMHRRAGFVSLRNGMESLVEELCHHLNGVKRSGVPSSRIEKAGDGLRVHSEGSPPVDAEAVVLAVPAHVAARLLSEIAPRSSVRLGEIRHTSTAVATLAYPMAAFPKEPHGNGFLVPSSETCAMTGCTWSSNKWEGRAPAGTLLLRCFMGRDGGLNVDDFTDDELIEQATAAIGTILKPRQEPTYRALRRWAQAMPQKVVGHTELLAEIEAGLEGLPIFLIGASYRSGGVPDCVRDGREAAEAIARLLD